IKSVLEEAVEVAPALRSDFLKKSCNGDEDLRREVEVLLDFDDIKSDFLEQNAFSAALPNGKDEGVKSFIGRQIGNYKITGELGAGGMGAVFLAERADGAFSQQVALKLIKRGMDSDAILRRFFTERQILASLKHPNIAHLIDGGTTGDNLPFFVMEHVEGETIIEYAERENLDLEERLKLFREVCAAVSFAHTNLVIHRDLKPSNILVTKDGNAKLLDFGIAKLLKSETAGDTATRNFVFTPEYASPEQVKGEKLTTATDVYSLGVILYELLTGNRPYETESKNISEIIRAVCETQPERPSSAARSVRPRQVEKGKTNQNKQRTTDHGRRTKSLKGDLDNIILKALRKEPERRYSSVEQFSEDIRRHLEGLPVTASRDTWKYRASKFIQRNRIGVAAIGLILLTLFAGLGATLYQANVARRERAKAEQRFADVRQLANSFMFEINEQIIKSPIKARELLVQRAVEYLDKLAAESANDIALQDELATAYEKIGDVQSEIFKPNSGKTSEALFTHQKALALRQKLFAGEPNAARAISVASSYLRVGDAFLMSGKISETRENYRAAVQILEPMFAAEPENAAVQDKLASSFARLGQSILRSGSLSESLENYEKSLKIYRNLAAENPETTKYQRNVGIIFSYIGFVKMEMGKTEEAATDYGNWLEIEKKIFEKDKNNIESSSFVSTAQIWFGVALSEQGKMQQAIAHFNEGIKIQEAVLAADKGNLGEEYALADCYLELGKALARNKMADESIKNLEKAIESYRNIWQKDAQNLMTRHRIANAQRFLADAFFQKENLSKASENYEQALAVFKELTAADTENVDWQQDLAMSYVRIGELSLKKSDKASALTNFEKALPIFENLAAKSPENVKRKSELETIKTHLAGLKS
ncbi:MAG: protein kinase, partial [Pyrinomonadaceae bacterium]